MAYAVKVDNVHVQLVSRREAMGPSAPHVPPVSFRLLPGTVKVTFKLPEPFSWQLLTISSVCQLGCTQCASTTGVCTACKSGFSQDANDKTKCNPPQSVTSSGILCPDGSFSNGSSCSPCSSTCQTCTGPNPTDCVICGAGKFIFNGGCVGVDVNGVCQIGGAPAMVADNNKHECDGKYHSCL
jgi:hypothetical protein